MSIDVDLPIDTNVSPGLHPQSVASLEVYDEDTAAILDPVASAFGVAYSSLSKLHVAREVVKGDPTLTESAQIIKTADFGDALFKRAAGTFDRVTAILKTQIAHFEKVLSEPVVAKASHIISTEVRAHAKGLDMERRHALITAAINSGDESTATAILGAPPYLSGLTAEMQKVLLTMWHRRANPQTAKRLKAAQQGLEQVISMGGLLHSSFEKAVGMHPSEVQKLRNARDKSNMHFTLKDL